jgi:DNA-binding GntR family transcriptional regulator
MESLPETLQDKVVEHLPEYLEELRDQDQWNLSFENTQQSLIMAAQRAKQEISAGKAQPLDAEAAEADRIEALICDLQIHKQPADIALEIPTLANYPSR